MTKEQKAVEFVENFIRYGFRIDTVGLARLLLL